MKAKVFWAGDNTYVAESNSGHAVVMQTRATPDSPLRAPSPMEFVLLGAGGCTCVDVVHILQRGRHDIQECVVEVDSKRAETEPKIFTHIHYHFIVTGRNLTPDVVKRAIDLSAEKYCSASIMLSKMATITHDFEIREAS